MKKTNQKLFASITASFIVICLLMQYLLPLFFIGNKQPTIVTNGVTSNETLHDLDSLTDVSDLVNSSYLDNLVQTNDEYENNHIDKDEEVWIIVQAKETSLLRKYLSTDKKVSLNEYIQESNNVLYQQKLLDTQNSIYRKIQDYCLTSVKYNYTTLLNGFCVAVKYGDIEKIEDIVGVNKVIISERYYPQSTDSSSSEITKNEVNVYETGIYNSSNVDYDGSGTLVAILDTGLDYTHSAFQKMPIGDVVYTDDEIAQILTQTEAYRLSYETSKGEKQLDKNDVYISKKVPFAYDYADKDNNVFPVNDHGTHVAGIIAGSDDTITGVATEAQLAIMKVFSDKDKGAETADILSALSDCVLLNVDVINMSLGSSCGFAREEDEVIINEIYDNVKDAGISLICAASNDHSSAFGSENGDTNLTSNPDSGTVGSPSTYAAAMSVASISGIMTPYFSLDGEAIYYTEASDTKGDQKHFMDELLGDKDELKLDYEVIPGTGSGSDYIGINIKGKVAVVKRGVITFEEKILTAQAKGAKAVIIYNNQSGTISMSVGNKTEIPSCSISMDMGVLFENKTSGQIVFSKSNLAGPFMSAFSSWGVMPNLELKPEITAHGGEILSAIRGGYDRLSGTSMACPNMAGAISLVRQYVKEKYPNLSNVEVTNLCYQIMMSTATIALNEYGNPYSPRKQGAGIADILKATTTDAYLWVNGSNKTKLNLGDDKNKTGHYELVFNITNISNKAQSYNVVPSLFTETVSSDGKTVAERAYMFNDYRYDVSVEGASLSNGHVILKGFDTATIKITIDLSEEDKAYLNENFKNGMFVEGFIQLINDNSNGVNLNIPYLAFYGDWTVAPILDVTEYEVAESAGDTSVLEKDKLKPDAFATVPLGGFTYKSGGESVDASWGLGVYGYNLSSDYEKPLSDEDKAAITENIEGLYSLKGISAGLIRGAKTIDMTIKDATTGEVVYQEEAYNGRKSYYAGSRTGGYIEINLAALKYGLKNNTKYTFSMSCYLDWEGEQNNLKNTFSFSFYVDSEKPVMDEEQTKVRIKEDVDGNKTYYLDMYVYDNHYLQCYTIGTYTSLNQDGSFNDYKPLIDGTVPIDSARGVTNKVTLDITKYWEDIKNNNLSLATTFIDYARNSSVYTFELPDTVAEKIEFTQESYTLRAYDSYDLFKIMKLTPDDSFKHLVSFTSSDESIVRVKDGEIYGVSEGEATISATTEAGAEAEINIIVKGKKSTKPTLESLDLGKDQLEINQGDEYKVTAKCDPWYFDSKDVEVSWRSTNSKIAKIEVDPTDPFTIVIRGLTSGSCSIVCSSGKYITSKIALTVKEEFVVDSRYLKEYNGRGDENGVVTIPDDKGIIYIQQYAFFDNDYIKKIIVPEGVTSINEAAFYGCENLEEIVLPESLETIESFGIAWNPNLKKVDLGGTKVIKKYGFIYDTSLEEIDLSNVYNIGQSAFYNCENLETIDISNVGGLGAYAFAYCTNLKNIIMTEKTQLLGDRAFFNCSSLTNVSIPSNYIATGTFYACSGLTNVVFTNSVTTIGEEAFASCSKLANVTYLKGVNTIASRAFSNCPSIQYVYLPMDLEVLSDDAYAGCKNIKKVTISKDALLTTIRSGAFADSSLLLEFNVEEGNKYLTSVDGILFDKSLRTLLLVPTGIELTSYQVPESVRTIGDYAFSYNDKLKTVDLNNVVRIGTGSFQYCTALSTINYGKNIETIGDYAFKGDSALTSITLPSSLKNIGEYAFANITNKDLEYSLVIPANLEEIGVGAFSNNGSITSVTFESGNNYTTLKDYLFANNTKLKKIAVPNGILTIGSHVFEGCTSLTTVTYPKSIVKFGTYNYYGDTALTFAYLPSTITTIPEGTFSGCTSITSYKATSNIETIDQFAFAQNMSLTSLDLGSVKTIMDSAFAETGILNITSNNISVVGAKAFSDCANLKRVYLPNATVINESAFLNDVALNDVTLTNVNTIGSLAFAFCKALAKLDLPNAKEICAKAFFNTGLTSINLPAVEKIEGYAFGNTLLEKFNVSNTVTDISEAAFAYTSKLTEFIAKDNANFFTDGGVLYSRLPNGKFELIEYPTSKTSTKYVVLDNTVRIAVFAFAGNSSLEEVELPNTLTHIGNGAFVDTKIKTYKFHSYQAPELESSYSKYFFYDTYYINFNTPIKEALDLNLTLYFPANGVGYNEYLYKSYFKNATNTEEIAPNEDTLYLKDLIARIPDNVTLEDKDLINEAASIYSILSKTMQSLITTGEKEKLEKAKLALDKLLK